MIGLLIFNGCYAIFDGVRKLRRRIYVEAPSHTRVPALTDVRSGQGYSADTDTMSFRPLHYTRPHVCRVSPKGGR
jgi:hypothetical protein